MKSLAVSVVSLPGLPLIPLIYASQVVNAVLLPLHAIALLVLASDPSLMGADRPRRGALALGWAGVALIGACVAALGVSWIGSL